MTAALELRKAGYKVQVLEFNSRPGGRNWTLRGGDTFTELGGATQTCEFEQGLYINPGPWRIPYHHHAVLDYCKRLNVALEPFIQLNHNALLHASKAFGGKPQRIREIKTDFQGQVSELLAKATNQGKLDDAVSKDDKEILLQALKSWGALDKDYAYKANLISAEFRGFAKDPGGGLDAAPKPGEPIALSDILKSRMWRYLQNFALHEFQTTMFQPVGGMDMIGKAFAREVGDVIRYDAKVTQIQQDGGGVTVTYVDTKNPAAPQQAKADWCVCTIPLSILSQLPLDVGARMKAAIDAVPYVSSVKIGLQFKRRFWEEDEAIYGGISYTDLPIRQIAYPNTGFNRQRPRRAARRLSVRGRQCLRIHRAGAGRAGRARGRIRRQPASAIQGRIRERRLRGLASRAVHAGLRRQLDRQGEGRALRQSLPDRRPHRAGGRARVLSSGMAGGRHPVVARRHRAAAPARGEDMRRVRASQATCGRRCWRLRCAPFAAHAQSAAHFSPAYRFTEQSGEQLFANVCQGCHMPDGKGAAGAGTYPSLAGNKNLEAGGYPVYVVVRGQRAMPPFGAMMSDDQVAAVVNYLRTHFGNDYKDAVTAEDVKVVRP